MFGFWKTKKTPAPNAPSASANAMLDVDGIFMGACVEHGLRGLGKNHRFQGAYANLPMFKCKTMPEGIEVAGSAEKKTSAILAENVMTVSTVGATPLHWSHLAVGIYCKHAFGMEPEWDHVDDGLVAKLAFGPSLEIEFTAKPSDDIDPMWTGERHPGASLLMKVQNVQPQGGTH